MTFKQYILNLRATDDPRGDFIGDVKRDKGFPDFKAYDLNRCYLESKGACEAAMDAFEGLYKQYEKKLKRRNANEQTGPRAGTR